MKLCKGCKKEKELLAFNFRNKKREIYHSRCKECTRTQVRKHYLNNLSYYLKKAQLRNTNERQIKREYLWKYLEEHPCVDCNEKDIVVLTFDHRENKSRNISDMIAWGSSFTQFINEIAKCEIRCANCHLRKTAIQQRWKKTTSARSSIG